MSRSILLAGLAASLMAVAPARAGDVADSKTMSTLTLTVGINALPNIGR